MTSQPADRLEDGLEPYWSPEGRWIRARKTIFHLEIYLPQATIRIVTIFRVDKRLKLVTRQGVHHVAYLNFIT